MDVQVQVAGQITSKPTSNGGTKFDIPLSNGMKASTFDAALATKVSQLGAQVFTARLEQKPNPRGGNPFTNINAAAGPGETLPPDFPAAGTPLGDPTTTQATPFVVGGAATPIVAAPTGNSGGWDDATTTRVSKLSAYERAVTAVGQLFQGAGAEAYEDMVEKIHDLARRVYTAARSHEPGAVPGQTPAPAAAVPGVGAEGVAPAAVPAAALPWGQ